MKIHYVVNCHVNTSISCIASLPFINSLPWPWVSKVSTKCTLQNLDWSSRSSGYFLPIVFQILCIWLGWSTVIHIL